jgi:hypothetical protein
MKFVIHRHAQGSECLRLFNQIKETVHDEWVSRLGTLTADCDDRISMMLQAADLLAYEVWRGLEYQNRERMRQPLVKLLNSQRVSVAPIGNRYFRRLLENGRKEQRRIAAIP